MQTTKRQVFEIRQKVGTVSRGWLETINQISNERVARNEYDRLIAQYPKDYFELVRVTHIEQCYEFSGRRVGEEKVR